jgi:hypothetical protein
VKTLEVIEFIKAPEKVDGTCAARKSSVNQKHQPTHVSNFSAIKFDYVAKMDVPNLGDMVTARWIVDWNIPDPAEGGTVEYRKVVK